MSTQNYSNPAHNYCTSLLKNTVFASTNSTADLQAWIT